MEHNTNEQTVIFDESMINQFGNKNSLVIVDKRGVNEIELSGHQNAVYTFGRDKDNSIFIDSEILSAHHGEIYIQNGQFFIKDNNSSNGTYVVYGQQLVKLMGDQYYSNDGKDMIIRLGAPSTIGGFESVLMLYDCNRVKGSWRSYALKNGDNSIGRDKRCSIVLKNVAVSHVHAGVRFVNNEMYLFDNKSLNGVYLNGQKVEKPTKLFDKDIFTILNTTFIVSGKNLYYKVNPEGINLETKRLNKVVDSKNGKKTILDKVDLNIKPNEFVAIIGGSGAGKTTLMTAMSGFDTDITGEVYCNGINLRENFQTLKNVIGFVPQQDIIYENLTLKKMLYYTAKLKMSEDTTDAEIDERIKDVLSMVELLEHQDTFIRRLSGGQKKRASIAVELLANPGLFFLDEPTSGLDPGTEQHLMQTLSRLSKEQEKTIIMVTHTTNNLHLCDKVIIMGYGGKLCYCGKPDGIKDFFATADIVQVYDKITADTAFWQKKFSDSGISKTEDNAEVKTGKTIKTRKVSSINQLSVLTRRYVALIKNDLERLAMIFIQPVLIGFLMALVAEKGIYDNMFETRSILFALMSAGIWMGLFNTIQEIYKERVILKREYMANLKLPLYMLSKYIVQAVIALIQASILVTVFVVIKGTPKCSGVVFNNASFEMVLTIFVTIYASAGFGLLISALSKTGDRAMTIAPFVLIIQLLFSGILFSLSGATDKISYVTFSRWSMEALGSTNNLNGLVQIGEGSGQQEFVDDVNAQIADMQSQYDENINELQDAVELYSAIAGDPQEFDEFVSEPVDISENQDDTSTSDDKENSMYVRKDKHMLWCWGLLFASTFLFAGVSIAALTKLADEQR